MPQKGDPVRGLPESIFEVDFAKGLSEHEDKWLQVDGFTRLENCAQDKAGAVVKMPGYSAFAGVVRNLTGEEVDTGIIEHGRPKLLQRGDQIGVASSGTFSAKADKWVVQGRVSPFVAEQRTVIEVDNDNMRIDCCRSGDWSFTVWEVAPGGSPGGADDYFRVAATYLPSGETILLPAAITASGNRRKPRIVAWDNTGKAILFYLDGPTTTTLHYRLITPDAVGAELTLETVDTYAEFDACSDPAGGFAWAFFCVNDAGGEGSATFRVRRYTIGATTLTGGPSVDITIPLDTADGTPSGLAIVGDHSDNQVAVAWWEQETITGPPAEYVPHLRGILFQSDPSAAVVWSERDVHVGRSAPVSTDYAGQLNQVAIVSLIASGGGHYYVWTEENKFFAAGEGADGSEFSTDRIVVRGKRVTVGGAVDAEVAQCGHVRLRSRPVFDSFRVFFLVEYAHQTTQNQANRHHYILAIDPIQSGAVERRFRPIGHFGYLTAGLSEGPGGANMRGLDDDLFRMSTPFQDANGGWHFQAIEVWGQGIGRQAIREYVLFEDDRVGVSAELGAQTYIAGALVSAWDGLRVLEAGFLHEPFFEAGSTIVTGAGGADLDAGTYHYKLTYARFSASGEVLRSAPSAELVVVSDGTNRATRIRTQSYIVTNEMVNDSHPHWLEVWRTPKNETSPFLLNSRIGLLATAVDPGDISTDTGLLPSFRQQIEFEDSRNTDGTEQLYSTGEAGGGELPNHPPTSALSICRWQNRILLTDGDQILYSKEGVPNRAAEFNRNQAIQRASRQKLTAVAPLGEIFAVFGEDETGFVYGDGPGPDGLGSTLTGPSILNEQAGCTQPAGLCVLPGGLFVPTRQGPQFLSLQREFSWVGAGIEDKLVTYPFIRDARMDIGENRLWLCLQDAARSNAVFAILDLTHKTWSTAFPAVTAAKSPASVISVGGEQMWASSNNSDWYVRTPGVYLLDAAGYSQVIETPWIKPAGPNGEIRAKRFWLLAEAVGALNGLKIEFAYDYAATYSHSLTIDETELAAFEGASSRVQVRRAFPRQRCGAFRMRFTSLEDSPGAAGLRFVSLRFAVALRKTNGRLLAAKNAGGAFT